MDTTPSGTLTCPRCDSPDHTRLHHMTKQYRLPAEWYRCEVCSHLFSQPLREDSSWEKLSEPGWWVVGAAMAGFSWLAYHCEQAWSSGKAHSAHASMPRHAAVHR